MAGVDAFRGITFQAAFCVELALDLLEGEAEVLLLEGTEDVIDARLSDPVGEAIKDIQAKTKVEPYSWEPADILAVIRRWAAADITDATRFEFVTDSSFGPTVNDTIKPLLLRAGEDALTVEDEAYLAKHNIAFPAGVLGRISLRSRQPDARTILERAVLRVLRVRELVQPVSTEEAETIVLHLFKETSLRSGEGEPTARTLSRNDAALIVGVSLDDLDSIEAWSQHAREAYLKRVAEIEDDPAWALLDLIRGDRPPALAFVLARRQDDAGFAMPSVSLLEHGEDALLCGPAGAGKTTTLAQLRGAALEAGLLPVAIRIDNYVSGSLPRLLRAELERHVRRRLPPTAVGAVLDAGDAVVLLDGVGELVPERRAAALEDLIALRDSHGNTARFILAARDPTALARGGLTVFDLQGLDEERRRTIAKSLLEESDDEAVEVLVRDIESDLPGVVDNPLLFVMAVGLRTRGVDARTRPDVFDGFVGGLQRRREGVALSDAALAAVRAASYALRSSGLYSADRWWWLEQVARVRTSLLDGGMLSKETPAADALVDELLAVGLLRARSEGAVGLLHDLFSDYFASEAVRHGLCEIPADMAEGLTEAVVFLAERDALDVRTQVRACRHPIAAARVADALPAAELNRDSVGAMFDVLQVSLGSTITESLAGTELRIYGEERRWAGLGPAGAADAQSFAERAEIAIVVSGEASSLSVAVDLWLACIRLALRERVPGKPFRRAKDTADLVVLIGEVVEARVEQVDALLKSILPGSRSSSVQRWDHSVSRDGCVPDVQLGSRTARKDLTSMCCSTRRPRASTSRSLVTAGRPTDARQAERSLRRGLPATRGTTQSSASPTH
jgi:hypothetical protein